VNPLPEIPTMNLPIVIIGIFSISVCKVVIKRFKLTNADPKIINISVMIIALNLPY
jgi:hypothetical protein